MEPCGNWLFSFWFWSKVLKCKDETGCASSYAVSVWRARGKRNKDKQHVWMWSRKLNSLRYFCQTPNHRKNSIRLIAVMCVGRAVISSAVISQLLWWTCEHETVAPREASRSTPISWYGDDGDVSFDLAVTAREEMQLADYLTCKSHNHLPAQFNTFTMLHHELCRRRAWTAFLFMFSHLNTVWRRQPLCALRKRLSILISSSLHCKTLILTSHFLCCTAETAQSSAAVHLYV